MIILVNVIFPNYLLMFHFYELYGSLCLCALDNVDKLLVRRPFIVPCEIWLEEALPNIQLTDMWPSRMFSCFLGWLSLFFPLNEMVQVLLEKMIVVTSIEHKIYIDSFMRCLACIIYLRQFIVGLVSVVYQILAITTLSSKRRNIFLIISWVPLVNGDDGIYFSSFNLIFGLDRWKKTWHCLTSCYFAAVFRDILVHFSYFEIWDKTWTLRLVTCVGKRFY